MSGAVQRGAALPLALLTLLVLAVAAATLVFLAEQDSRIGDARLAQLRARLAAEAAVAFARAEWSSAALADLPYSATRIGAVRPLAGGGAARADVQRLAGDLFLIRGFGRSAARGQPARASAGLLVRAVTDSVMAAAATAGVVAAGGVLVGVGGSVAVAEDTCGGAALLLSDAAQLLDGADRVGGAVLLDANAGSGHLPHAFASGADHGITGAVSAAPVVAAATCDVAVATNWGDPLDPLSPCAGHAPLIHAAGDLHVSGVGQGVLAVEGDLVFAAGAVFRGIVIASGDVRVDPGARIEGSVRSAAPHAVTRIDGIVHFDRCIVARAARVPALDRAFTLPARAWIPLYGAPENM